MMMGRGMTMIVVLAAMAKMLSVLEYACTVFEISIAIGSHFSLSALRAIASFPKSVYTLSQCLRFSVKVRFVHGSRARCLAQIPVDRSRCGAIVCVVASGDAGRIANADGRTRRQVGQPGGQQGPEERLLNQASQLHGMQALLRKLRSRPWPRAVALRV